MERFYASRLSSATRYLFITELNNKLGLRPLLSGQLGMVG